MEINSVNCGLTKQGMVRGAIVGVTCAVLLVFGLVVLLLCIGFPLVVLFDSSEYHPDLLSLPEIPQVEDTPPAQGPPSPDDVAEEAARRSRYLQPSLLWAAMALLLYLIFLYASTMIAIDVYRSRYPNLLRWHLPLYFSLFGAFAFVSDSAFAYNNYLESFYNTWPAEMRAREMERAWIGAWAYFQLQNFIATKMLAHGPFFIGSILYIPVGLLFWCYYAFASWILERTLGGSGASPKSKSGMQNVPEA